MDRAAEAVVPCRAGEAGDPRLHHAQYGSRPRQLDDQGRLAHPRGLDRIGAAAPEHEHFRPRRGAAAGGPDAEDAAGGPRLASIPDAEAHERIQPSGQRPSGPENHDRRHRQLTIMALETPGCVEKVRHTPLQIHPPPLKGESYKTESEWIVLRTHLPNLASPSAGYSSPSTSSVGLSRSRHVTTSYRC